MSRLFKIISALFLIGIIFIAFSGFQIFAYNNIINQLFENRIDILQKAFYGKIKFEDAENCLEAIETSPILIGDLQYISSSDSTEIDIVEAFEINKIEKIKDENDLLAFSATITWKMQGVEGYYIDTHDYIITLKKDGNIYKISDYYPQI